MNNSVLVTGGAGYIGAHVIVKLLNNGYSVIAYDNLKNSSQLVFDRISRITSKKIKFIQGDVCDAKLLNKVFCEHKIDSVIHLAGLKSVVEAENNPLLYYQNNVSGSATLFQEMVRAKVTKIIFSSSATVYGNSEYSKYAEDTPLSPTNVYGKTKLIVENILKELSKVELNLKVAILRYFNPVGAHKSGLIGECPIGIPNNLIPIISQVALGIKKELLVFGGDYPTFDGTARRDYIHVEDLASGHLAALELINNRESFATLNLGTGQAYSVLEIVKAYERVSGVRIPYKIVQRRNGDLAEYYADPGFAKKKLNWAANFDINQMCEDAWNWHKNNPEGYI